MHCGDKQFSECVPAKVLDKCCNPVGYRLSNTRILHHSAALQHESGGVATLQFVLLLAEASLSYPLAARKEQCLFAGEVCVDMWLGNTSAVRDDLSRATVVSKSREFTNSGGE